MKIAIVCSALLLMLTVTRCDTQKPITANLLLLNCWTHSYEEQTEPAGTDVFRPCDYKNFGPSRYRLRMVLKANDEAEYLQLSPVDAHTMVSGTWQYDASTKTLQVIDTNGIVVWTYEVVDSDPDKLLLVPRH